MDWTTPAEPGRSTPAPSSYRVITAHGSKDFSPDTGYVLPHEHILIDMRVYWGGEGTPHDLDDVEETMSPELSDELRRWPQRTTRENLVLSDWYMAAEELRLAQNTGCQLVVDLTTTGLSPLPALARKAADLAGLDLVVPVGHYLHGALTAEDRERSVDDLERSWQSIIEQGFDGCAVGIIGEIGTSAEIAEPEQRALHAAARVQQRSGLSINVHLHPYARRGLEALAILEQAGADLSRVALSHCDGDVDVAWLKQLLARGCYVEFDLFGTGPDWHVEGKGFSTDEQRVDALDDLCTAGYSNRLLLSHDICMRNSLRHYGGWGYAYLGQRVFPVLDARLGPAVRRQLTAVNPLDLLAIRK